MRFQFWMNTNRFLIILLGVAMFLVRLSAAACSCFGETDPKTALRESAAVFTGRVAELTLTPNNSDPQLQEREVTFEVESVWKGDVRKRVRVRTALNSAMCGYAFERGVTYIIYATAGHDRLNTNICSRTKPLNQAQSDLHALGVGTKPK